MLLHSAQIRNFRSIEDSSEFPLDRVTCLVGKNESGKTTVLQALSRIKPVLDGPNSRFRVGDYPKRKLIEMRRAQRAGGIDVVTSTWVLEPDDRNAIAEFIGPRSLTSPKVVVTTGYDNSRRWDVEIDERQVVRHFLSTVGMTEEQMRKMPSLGSVNDLLKVLERTPSLPPKLETLKDNLETMFPDGDVAAPVAEMLDKRLPSMMYFSQYERLSGRVSIPELLRRRTESRLTEEDRIFLSLLDLSGVSLDDLLDLDDFEQLISEMELISHKLTQEIISYWNSDEHLSVDFRFDAANPNEPPPYNEGYIFRTRIRNSRHGVTIGLDERSSGFAWFFSFLVAFSQLERDHGRNLFLLLDEPALTLGPAAQSDWLRYIYETLAAKHQIVYTTHSPFMIAPSKLDAVRVVEDVHSSLAGGTRVSRPSAKTESQTAVPLRVALGYEVSHELIGSQPSLFVDDATELIYLRWFSQALKASGRDSLDPRWQITPSGGFHGMAALLALRGGTNGQKLAVLGSGHSASGLRSKDLEAFLVGRILWPGRYVDMEGAAIEDLLGRDVYARLVNRAYALDEENAWPEVDEDGVTGPLRDIFAKPDPRNGAGLDRLRVATTLPDSTTGLIAEPGLLNAAMDRFERLFRDINKLLD